MSSRPMPAADNTQPLVRTPDHRVRVYVSSALEELAPERAAVRDAISALRLTPVMLGPGAPREVYSAHLQQSHIFVGLYWESYGPVVTGMALSALEDEYCLSAGKPRLIYIKSPAPGRDDRLQNLIKRVQEEDTTSYKPFSTTEELRELVENDLALLLTEGFELAAVAQDEGTQAQGPEDTRHAGRTARRDNLPAVRSPLVGRENELASARQLLLRADVGLVTLTGPGGSGKTRLALQVGKDLLGEFEDGVYLVPLAALTDPNLVAPAIARVLDVREAVGMDIVEALKDYLRGKHILLILDNSEQVPTVGSLLVELLDRCPRLTVLVTSRQPLHVRGEREFSVPPLEVPRTEGIRTETPLLEGLSKYSAVELFVQRAREVRLDFALTQENWPALAEICRRLDGLPLAIELAAARIRLLTPQAMLAHLEKRLNLLTGGPRDLPARQQTLRSTIDWSYNLLGDDEKRLFARLAVFSGGCTLEAAEAVCLAGDRSWVMGDGGGANTHHPSLITGSEATIDGIGSLVDKNLLVQHEQEDGEPRFSMLETIREYALERLEAMEEEANIKQQHAGFYLHLAEEAEQELGGHRQAEFFARLELEQENLREALAWAIETTNDERRTTNDHRPSFIMSEASPDRPDIGLRLAGALWRFWYLRGLFTEGRKWLKQVLDLPGAATQSSERAKALNGAGRLAHGQGDYAEAQVLFEESLAISRQLGDQEGIAAADNSLGMVSAVRGDYVRSEQLLNEALAINRTLGARSRVADSLNYLGDTAHMQGHYARARRLEEESLDIFTELADRWGMSQVLTDLGDLMSDSADYAAAHTTYQRSLSLQELLGDKRGSALTLMSLGLVAWKQSDYAQARELFERCLDCFRDLGDKKGIASALNYLGNVALYRGNDEGAGRLYEQSLAIRTELGDKRDLAATYNNLGLVAMHKGNFPRARSMLETALSTWRQVGDRERTATTLSNLGREALAEGDPNRAKELFEEARGMTRDLDDKWSYAYALSGLAQLARHQHLPDEADPLFVESLRLRSALTDRRSVARSLLGFAWVAGERGDYERGARLLGAAEGIRETIGAGWEPALRAEVEQAVAGARSQLGEEVFGPAWAEGRGMSVQQAIAYALNTSPSNGT